MASPDRTATTHVLLAAVTGDSSASEQLLAAVYDELRGVAAAFMSRERIDHTLQPTALVHEAYLRLIDQTRVQWQGRAHFMAIAAQTMRRILVDHARTHGRERRGGHAERILLTEDLVISNRSDEDILVLDDLLQKLAVLDPRHAQIVELRFFGGLSVEDVAATLGITDRTIRREWTMIRAWLRSELKEEEHDS